MNYYGLPIEKKIPLNNESEVLQAVTYFNNCPKIKRKGLADNINKRLQELDLMITPQDGNDFIYYIDKRYYADGANIQIKPVIVNHCKDIHKIPAMALTVEEYNERVFNTYEEMFLNTKDSSDTLGNIRSADEYADSIVRNKLADDIEYVMILDVINILYDALYLVTLQYNVSKDYMENLLSDLEEMYLLCPDKNIIKRKLLILNYACSQTITSELNKTIAKATRNLLEGKVSHSSIGKVNLLHIKNTNGMSVIKQYLQTKQKELKEQHDKQSDYFFSHNLENDRKVMDNEEYTLFYAETELRDKIKDIIYFKERYPKLEFDLSYSDIFRLKNKFDIVKPTQVGKFNNLVLTVLNDEPTLLCKNKTDDNIFYAVNLRDMLNSSVRKEWYGSVKHTAKKIIFKSTDINTNGMTLESCVKF